MPSLFLHSPPLLPKTLPLKSLKSLHFPPPYRLRRHVRRRITSIAAVDSAGGYLPAVRSYESDLARLTLVGSVDFDQALSAAAADGGDAAEEHLVAGTSTMVVETVFPGSADDHSTVSTRLFLPAKKVKEKAKKLRSSLTADIFSNSSMASKNILAMTFRQVVVHGVGNFKLSLFSPGTERDMENLLNSKKAPEQVTVSLSDERFISRLAEVVCSCLLKSTEISYRKHVGDLPSKSIFGRYEEPQRISSFDSSISLYRMPKSEVMKIAREQLVTFNLAKENSINWSKTKAKYKWWEPPDYSKLDKVGGPGFSTWISEFLPVYKLQVDGNVFKDAIFEGWEKSDNNRWEVLLTHYQMVELASVLDMYYEDQYTLPDKELSCGLVAESPITSKNKNSSGKWLFVSLAGGCILIVVNILSQLYWPNRLKATKIPDPTVLSSTETCGPALKSLEAPEIEGLCVSMVKKVRDELGWTEDIVFERDVGAWAGLIPSCLRDPSSKEKSFSTEDVQTSEKSTVSDVDPVRTDELAMETAQDIASYQVVLSGDSTIIGFQPTSRVAVNNWASNPLARSLHRRKQLSPGILEPRLNLQLPKEVVILELLMSTKPETQFILVRPTT